MGSAKQIPLEAMMAKRRGTKANRTKRGGVSASARRKYGTKRGGNRKGSFPVFDKKSARSALKLRGHAKNRSAVISKVSAYASRHNDKGLKTAVKKARAKDRKK